MPTGSRICQTGKPTSSPAPWAIQFPFSTNYIHIGSKDIAADFRFSGGTLRCNAATCRRDTSGCTSGPSSECTEECLQGECTVVLEQCAKREGCDDMLECLDRCRSAPSANCVLECVENVETAALAIIASDCVHDCTQRCGG